MIVLYVFLLALFSLGIVYGFYEVVYRWLKPKAERMIPKLKSLVPKIPKRKPRLRTTSPQDIVSEAHARHEQLASRPWGVVYSNTPQSAQAAKIKQRTNQAENDMFWNQVAMECQRIAGHTDFKSYDPRRGKK